MGPSIQFKVRAPFNPGLVAVTARLVEGSRDGNPDNDSLVIPISVFARRSRAIDRHSQPFPFGSILWIGAHPDDEILIAPLLGNACKEHNARCHFLAATRGEAGPCALSSGCNPDVGSVREIEMRTSGALFNAAVTQWRLVDGSADDPAEVLDHWAKQSGGEDQLIDLLARQIRDSSVEAVITFDSSHGSTGHADHRAVGALVRRAMERIGRPGPTLFLLESLLTIDNSSGFRLSITPAIAGGFFAYDANQLLPHFADIAWRYTIFTALIYRSQYGIDWLRAIENLHPGERRVYLLKVPPD